MSATVSLTGFAELEQSLDNISRAAGKSALRRALMRAAEPTAEIARGMAPVDKGTLRDSIVVGAKLNKRQARLHRRMFRDDRSSVELFIGPSYLLGAGGRHGHLLEFGTYKTTPQPFMRPAWDSDKMAMLARLKEELWTQIQASTARAARSAARRAARAT